MELDHLFVFIEPDSDAVQGLLQAGLKETYRRTHLGQGTANLCFCFDNLYIECIYLTNALEAASPAIQRTGLLERSAWRTNGSCPFGLAWRGVSARDAGINCWDYTPPYLPPNMAIQVAEDSDDVGQPMMFTFDGATPPSAWPAIRQNGLQLPASLGAITSVQLTLPATVSPSSALRTMQSHGVLDIREGTREYGLALGIADRNKHETVRLALPEGVLQRKIHE